MNYVFCVFCATFLPAQDEKVDLDFTRISQPAVASQLELSDEQRSKIAALLVERINKLAAAKPEERATIRKSNNDALKALLSPTQLTKYQEILTGGKLRFNFRGEKWSDVLNWFARQSELSLVMNETPPGDFTYADQKEYTSPQAIDLLNSVLLSKGYTLIRREKMLIVANLKTGIPYELVPDETLEGLTKRGKFEWVRIKFPLGGRPIAAVLEEVKPMISEQGKATALAASGQLLVTETAGKMEAIGVLVSAVPVPKSAPPPPQPTPAPPKVFVVHSAKGLDITGTVETLQKFFATTAVVGDAKAEEIQVYAPQSTQDLIKSSLDQMIKNASTELKAYTEVYPIDPQSISNVQEQLANLFANTTFSVDSQSSRLIVSANAKVHKGIQETLNKLGASSDDKSNITVVIYAISKGESQALGSVLTEMLPRAQVIVQGNRIAVRGKPADHQIAKSLVEQISADSASKETMQIRFYELNENLSDITSTIQAIVEDGTVTWLESQQKLSVIADAATQELVKSTIDQVNSDLPKKKSKSLKIFAVTATQKAKFLEVFEGLASEFGDATLVSGAGTNEIAVLADPEQQQAIESVLKSISTLDADDKVLTSIPVSVADTSQLISLLEDKLPNLEFLPNPENDTLFAWIKEKEIEAVKQTVASVEAILPKRTVLSLEVYEIKGSVTEIAEFISPIANNAKITNDANNKRLIVWATASEHEKIKSTIGKIDVLNKTEKSLEVYELKNVAASVAQSMIANLETDATMTTSEDSKSLLVWASSEEHVKIKSLIERLGTIKTTAKSLVELYPVDRESGAKTLAAVQAVFPNANVSLDTASRRIISIADAELQSQIKSLIDKLRPDKPTSPKVLMSYELKNSDAATVVAMLNDLHPQIRFAADERANRVLVTAELTEQPRFKAIISQLDAKSSDRDEKTLKSYDFQNIKSATVNELIQPLLPEMKFSVDETTRKMTVLGTLFEHQKLSKLLEQIQSKTVTPKVLKHYPIGNAPVDEVRNVLLQVVPTAVIAVNGGQGKIVIWATAEEQKIIETAINQLNNVSSEEMSLKSFDLDRQVSADIVSFMQGLSKTARVSASGDGMQIVVLGTAGDIALFKSVIEELNQTGQEDLSIKAYTATEEVIVSANAIVSNSFPKAKLVSQPDPKKLVVWASKDDHAKIKTAIGDLTAQLVQPEKSKTTIIYPLGKVAKTTAVELITSDAKTASILSDPQTNRLIVRADTAAHKSVAQILADLKITFDAIQTREIKSHKVREDLKSQATTTISSLLPDAEFLANGNDASILVKATAADHLAIAELLKTLESEIVRKEPRTIKAYPLEGLEKSLTNQILTDRFPNISFVSEENSNRVLIWAVEKEHARIPEMLKSLETTIAAEKEMVVEVYNIDDKKMTAADVMELIDARLKENATFQVASATNSLIVRASKARHPLLKAEIDAIVTKIVAAPSPTTKIYEFPAGNASSVSSLVSPLLSNTTISVSPDEKKFAATSNKEGHLLIQSVIDQLKQKATAKDFETIVYKLNAAVPSVITNAISAMSPKAQITADDNSMSLIVTASKSEHLVIANILKQINDSSLGKKTEVFTLAEAAPASLVNAISDLVSNATVTADDATNSVIVTALATDFPQIQSIVDKLDQVATDRSKAIAKVYPFDKDLVDAVDMQNVIDSDMREGMSVRVNEVGNGLIIRTTPEKHAQLKIIFDQVVAQLPAKQKIETRVYRLNQLAPSVIETVLAAKYSRTDFAVDATTRTVVATVSIAEHDKIKSTIDEMEKKENTRKVVSKAFKLKVSTPSAVSTALSSLLPNATVTTDNLAQSVIVTGTDDEIQSATELVTQIDSSDLGKTTQVYKLVEADPRFVSPAIEQLIPTAKISADRYSKSLFVTATEEEHKQVAKMVEELNTKKGQRSEVYKLDTADPRYLSPAVQALIPNATVSADRFSKTLFVTGTDDDHKQVQGLIEKLNSKKGQRSEVYKLAKADPRYLSPAIEALIPNATVSADRISKTLFVTGSEEDHKQVAALIEKLNGRGTGQTTEVYKLNKASAVIIQPALTALIPDGNVTADKLSNTIVVSASEEDQAKVADVIEKLDKATGDELILKIYKSKFDNPDPINNSISNMFRGDPEVRINYEWENRRILIVTSEAKHKLIESLIAQIDQGKPEYEDRFAKVYHLENIESRAAEGVVRNLYGWWVPRIDVRVEEKGTNALIIVATGKQHKDLGPAISEVDGDLRQLEVFALVNVDPYTVELAIEQLFEDVPENMRPSSTSDFGTQQLFVRGSKSQIKLVRDLLNKMGENFGDSPQAVSKGGVRTIPFRGNAMDALREIEEFWPRIRKNRIEIIRPNKTRINRRFAPQKSTPAPEDKQKQSNNSQPDLPENCGGEYQEKEETKNAPQNEEPKIQIEKTEPDPKGISGSNERDRTSG